MCVCNPASTTDNLCPTLGGGIPTRTGRLRAATLSSLNCYRWWTSHAYYIVEASREATAGKYARGRDITRMPTSIGVVGMVRAAWGVPT
eukprot:scaffold37804_cov62-Attheya_sp.AAC.1